MSRTDNPWYIDKATGPFTNNGNDVWVSSAVVGNAVWSKSDHEKRSEQEQFERLKKEEYRLALLPKYQSTTATPQPAPINRKLLLLEE